MTIKLSFINWMKFGKRELNHARLKWEDAGLKEVSLSNSDMSMEFKVFDKSLFFLSIIQYGIEFEEIVDTKKLREDVNVRMF